MQTNTLRIVRTDGGCAISRNGAVLPTTYSSLEDAQRQRTRMERIARRQVSA